MEHWICQNREKNFAGHAFLTSNLNQTTRYSSLGGLDAWLGVRLPLGSRQIYAMICCVCGHLQENFSHLIVEISLIPMFSTKLLEFTHNHDGEDIFWCTSLQPPRHLQQESDTLRLLQKAREGKETSIRTENTRSGAFVFHSTCFFGHRRNGERGNLFLQTSGFHARSEVGSLILHHTLLAEVPIDLLPYSLSHTIPTRSKIFSTSCCPLPSSNRPCHHWVPYHTRLLNPLFHLKVSFFYLFCADSVSTVAHPLLYISFNIIFNFSLSQDGESKELQ